MKCPNCSSSNDKVIDSRSFNNDENIKRRRECIVCNHRWTTYEYRSDPERVKMLLDGYEKKINSLANAIIVAQKILKK